MPAHVHANTSFLPRQSCGFGCSTRRSRRDNRTATSAILQFLNRTSFEPLSDQLPASTLQWLRAKGLPPQQLAAREVGVEGRGLIANRRIKAEEPLLQVPRSLLLTAEDALAASQLSAEMERADLPAWSVLAMYLVECRMRQDSAAWQPYVSMLPEASSSVGNCLEWNEAQVDRLAGLKLHADAREIRAAADACWQQVQQLLREPSALTVFGNQPARADFQWAFSMLLSRLIRLSSLGHTEALVPWADLLNHSTDTTACLDWDASLGSVVYRPTTLVEARQQLYCSYGPKSSGQLLLSYGFVPDGINQHEAVELELALAAADPLFAEKARTLAAAGLQQRQRFPMKLGAFPDGLFEYAAILSAADSSQLQSAWAAQRARDLQLLEASNRVAAMRLVRSACRQQLDALAVGSKPAVSPAATPAASSGGAVTNGSEANVAVEMPRLEQLVAEVRVREGRILNRAVFLLTQMMREQPVLQDPLDAL